MSELNCGTCTQCCQWGNDVAIRPKLTNKETRQYRYTKSNQTGYVLEADKNGNCVYLGLRGCTIYETRPSQCRGFDCRDLYSKVKETPFIKVILQGQVLSDKGGQGAS